MGRDGPDQSERVGARRSGSERVGAGGSGRHARGGRNAANRSGESRDTPFAMRLLSMIGRPRSAARAITCAIFRTLTAAEAAQFAAAKPRAERASRYRTPRDPNSSG